MMFFKTVISFLRDKEYRNLLQVTSLFILMGQLCTIISKGGVGSILPIFPSLRLQRLAMEIFLLRPMPGNCSPFFIS